MAGKRYSRQREMIYRAVVGSKEHPTAEMVYQWLKPANPNLSLGTVYRNLNLLAEEGILIRPSRWSVMTPVPNPTAICAVRAVAG